MSIRIVRLGTPREPGEGLRLGTVRRPPRGVRKSDYSRLDHFDLWLPDLAPSARLLARVRSGDLTQRRWASFARRYRSEMARPVPTRLISLLAALSSESRLSIGCYCEDAARCHRSILRVLLLEAGGTVE
jgi:uncharacterized protein YeaO (DUF488 family)